MTDLDKTADRPAREGERDTPEIEITPEMIEAGLSAYCTTFFVVMCFFGVNREDAVRAIYQAMMMSALVARGVPLAEPA